MKTFSFALSASVLGVVLLTGCTSTNSVEEETTSDEVGVSAEAEAEAKFCSELDPLMNSFVEKLLAGENAETEWSALNPIFLDPDRMATFEDTDLKSSMAVFAGITISPAAGSESLIGEETTNILFACENVGSPMSLTQATIDAATK